MSFFTQNGDFFTPTPGREALLESLPVGNYVVVQTMEGLKFKRVPSFNAPGRMYGDIESRADRILGTFMDRPRTTGVLLSGEKGSGKSQLARNISYRGYAEGLPTILVNAPFAGDAFNALLASIEQPAIVLMDEFEKVYADTSDQEQVLTLLDGMMTSHKLFILTVNNKYKVNENLKNRPGRIFYSLQYEGLDPDFIKEYCEENLHDTSQIEGIMKVAVLFQAFNFDMLKAMVEEMNRYKESAFEAIEWLNAKPIDNFGGVTYEVFGEIGGVKSKVDEINEVPLSARNNVLGLHLVFPVPVEGGKDQSKHFLQQILGDDYNEVFDEDKTVQRYFTVHAKDLKKIDVDKGHFEFEAEGAKISFTRKPFAPYNLSAL